ncbi:ribokinase [Microbacterium sp. zg.Y625]|uniref:ribokinase n=1 Tax=Microbacterium jiangjiandongii TaxID=3049071 RepID=UPI00214C11CF|nr:MULTISPECIES: ribokinase [unclassified Microbacterium]MCR2792010.1 ribokinase [Microbacterium sp. zg.Y625]WIM24817.1 ribokinase [Microbacterium sp. zg-Y625]
MSSVVVLGSANLDLVVRQPRLPQPGETMFGSSFTTVPGGKGLNQAIAAARTGAEVVFLGAVGRDAFGTQLREALQADGVATEGLIGVDVPTGTAHIAVLGDGENSIVIVPGANAAVRQLDKASRVTITRARYLVAQLERPLDLVSEAFALARAAGVRTVLTPAPAQPLEPLLLENTDILIPNSGEACALAGLDDDRDAAAALSSMAGLVVMTRGPRGATVAQGGGILFDVAPRVVEAVDTTGAGDTFAGVLVARLSLGESLERALHAATVAASIAVTRPGASTSMPTWTQVEALL